VIVSERIAQLTLSAGLVVATLGMALVVFGVVISVLFFPGVYLLALGLLAAGLGALLRVVTREPA
jgi:hypothetical protein